MLLEEEGEEEAASSHTLTYKTGRSHWTLALLGKSSNSNNNNNGQLACQGKEDRIRAWQEITIEYQMLAIRPAAAAAAAAEVFFASFTFFTFTFKFNSNFSLFNLTASLVTVRLFYRLRFRFKLGFGFTDRLPQGGWRVLASTGQALAGTESNTTQLPS